MKHSEQGSVVRFALWPRCLAICAAVSAALAAQAQTSISNVVRDPANLIQASAKIDAYGTDLFGDSVNVYTGEFSLSNVDVSIPGNDALAVEVRRSLNRPGICRHLGAIIYGDRRGVNEQQAIYGRVQG